MLSIKFIREVNIYTYTKYNVLFLKCCFTFLHFFFKSATEISSTQEMSNAHLLFQQNQCRTKCLYDPCNEYNNWRLFNPLQKKILLLLEEQKFGTIAIRQNECFLICTCPVSYPNMGILKMKKSLDGVPKILLEKN